MSLYPWDYAAAALIVTEAGGMLATMEGEELRFSDRTTLVAGDHPPSVTSGSYIFKPTCLWICLIIVSSYASKDYC